MTNDEALAILAVKRNAVNAAINGVNLYRQQQANWLASYKTTEMNATKAHAAIVGADIDAWDGSDPAEEE